MAAAGDQVSAEPRVITLSARPQPLSSLLRGAWEERSLAWALGRQGFLSGYRRASLGVLWAVVLPIVQTIAMAIVFSRVVRISTPINYVAFVLSGMVCWSFFVATFGAASTAIVDSAGMASRIYFPRLLLPIVRLLANIYPFVISLVLMVVVSILVGIRPGPRLLAVIPATVMLMLLTAGFSLVASALHVYFRDVRFLVAGSLSVWFYGTPVFYPLRFVGGALRTVVVANPVTGVIEMMRLGLGAADPGAGTAIAVSCAWIALLLGVATILHRRYDRLFSDLM